MMEFYTKNKKLVDLIATAVVCVLIVASLLVAVFIGGELFSDDEEETEKTVIGSLTITSADYETEYELFDNFIFDKDTASIKSMVYDPNALVENDDPTAEPEYGVITTTDKIDAADYGFSLNGTGALVMDASLIVITADTVSVDIVLVDYPTVSKSIAISIAGADTDTEA